MIFKSACLFALAVMLAQPAHAEDLSLRLSNHSGKTATALYLSPKITETVTSAEPVTEEAPATGGETASGSEPAADGGTTPEADTASGEETAPVIEPVPDINILASGALEPDQTTEVPVAREEGQCVFDLKVQFADSTERVRNDMDLCQTAEIIIE